MRPHTAQKKTAIVAVSSFLAVSCAGPTTSVDRSGQWHRMLATKPAAVFLDDAPPPKILPETYYSAGRLFESQKLYRKALIQYQKAVALNHSFVDAYHRLGLLYSRMGDRDNAMDALVRAAELAPGNPIVRNNLGFELLLSGRLQEAETEFTSALELEPSFVRARINLAIAQSRRGRMDEALMNFQAVLPEADAYFNLGLMFRSQKRYVEAVEAFEHVISIDPEFVAAWKHLDSIDSKLARRNRMGDGPDTVTAADATGQSPAGHEGTFAARRSSSPGRADRSHSGMVWGIASPTTSIEARAVESKHVDEPDMADSSTAQSLADADSASPATDSFDSPTDVYADEFPSPLSMTDANFTLTAPYPFESLMDPITDDPPTFQRMADADNVVPVADSDESAADANDTPTATLEELDFFSADSPYYFDDQFSVELDSELGSSDYRTAEFDETSRDDECDERRLVGSRLEHDRDALTALSSASPPTRITQSASRGNPEKEGSNECVADAETILAVIQSFGPQVCDGTALPEETSFVDDLTLSTSDGLATLRELDGMLTEVQNEIRCLESDDPTLPTIAVLTARFIDPVPETSHALAENEPSVLDVNHTDALSAYVTRMSREGYAGTESTTEPVHDNVDRGRSSMSDSTEHEAIPSNVRLAADRQAQPRQAERTKSPGILFRLISLVSPCSFAQLAGKSCDPEVEQDQVRSMNRQGVDAVYDKRHPREWPLREVAATQ